MLIVSLLRLKLSMALLGSEMSLLSASDGRSMVVKIVPHFGHLRRLQTEGLFLCGRELATLVFLWKQFMQNMSIY